MRAWPPILIVRSIVILACIGCGTALLLYDHYWGTTALFVLAFCAAAGGGDDA